MAEEKGTRMEKASIRMYDGRSVHVLLKRFKICTSGNVKPDVDKSKLIHDSIEEYMYSISSPAMKYSTIDPGYYNPGGFLPLVIIIEEEKISEKVVVSIPLNQPNTHNWQMSEEKPEESKEQSSNNPLTLLL